MLVSTIVGVAVGGLWTLLAPRADYRVAAGQFVRVSAQPEQYFAADLMLGALLAVAGLGLALWWALRNRQRPLAALLGLLIGGLVAGVVAALVGRWLTAGPDSAAGLADGTLVQAGLNLRSLAMLVWWPTAVAVVFAVALAGWEPDPEGAEHTRRAEGAEGTQPVEPAGEASKRTLDSSG